MRKLIFCIGLCFTVVACRSEFTCQEVVTAWGIEVQFTYTPGRIELTNASSYFADQADFEAEFGHIMVFLDNLESVGVEPHREAISQYPHVVLTVGAFKLSDERIVELLALGIDPFDKERTITAPIEILLERDLPLTEQYIIEKYSSRFADLSRMMNLFRKKCVV